MRIFSWIYYFIAVNVRETDWGKEVRVSVE